MSINSFPRPDGPPCNDVCEFVLIYDVAEFGGVAAHVIRYAKTRKAADDAPSL